MARQPQPPRSTEIGRQPLTPVKPYPPPPRPIPEQRVALEHSERADSYYSPRRIEAILRQLPYLPESGVHAADIRPMQAARGKGSDRLERQMCERADVERALAQLRQPTYRIVYLCHVGGKSIREVAELLNLSYRRAREARTAGVRTMAEHLGWSDPRA